jgi:putative sigma-54 modulation protein
MRIEVQGHGLQVTDELRECVQRRFDKVAKQVSELAVLEVDLTEGPGPEGRVAEAALHLKGVTLRARDSSRDVKHAVNLVAEDMARQVKRHRDKRRNRRETRAATARLAGSASPPPGELPAV